MLRRLVSNTPLLLDLSGLILIDVGQLTVIGEATRVPGLTPNSIRIGGLHGFRLISYARTHGAADRHDLRVVPSDSSFSALSFIWLRINDFHIHILVVFVRLRGFLEPYRISIGYPLLTLVVLEVIQDLRGLLKGVRLSLIDTDL